VLSSPRGGKRKKRKEKTGGRFISQGTTQGKEQGNVIKRKIYGRREEVKKGNK